MDHKAQSSLAAIEEIKAANRENFTSLSRELKELRKEVQDVKGQQIHLQTLIKGQ